MSAVIIRERDAHAPRGRRPARVARARPRRTRIVYTRRAQALEKLGGSRAARAAAGQTQLIATARAVVATVEKAALCGIVYTARAVDSVCI